MIETDGEQKRRIGQGDRVACIAPNTHGHLEAYYAVPQIGAVLVPINYRLLPADFEYIVNHSGAKVVCVHSDYLKDIDSIRARLPNVTHFVALEGKGEGWLDYEATLAASSPGFTPVDIAETDLITINYTSGTTARPKGVMITHRNAWVNTMGTLAHHHLSPADRYSGPPSATAGSAPRGATSAAGRAEADLDLTARKITMFPGRCHRHRQARPTCRRAPRGVFTPARRRRRHHRTVEREGSPRKRRPSSPSASRCRSTPAVAAGPRRVKRARRRTHLLRRVAHRRRRRRRGSARRHRARQCREGYNRPAAIRDGWSAPRRRRVHPDGCPDRSRTSSSGGENISSVEVEGCLLRHPAVQEAAVVGMPHQKWGESPHAFVILRAGASATEDELKKHVRDSLAHFKTPQWVSFVEELPNGDTRQKSSCAPAIGHCPAKSAEAVSPTARPAARGVTILTLYRAIGLMSGTSMDGVDIALIETDGEDAVTFGATGFQPYSDADRALLRAALQEAAACRAASRSALWRGGRW